MNWNVMDFVWAFILAAATELPTEAFSLVDSIARLGSYGTVVFVAWLLATGRLRLGRECDGRDLTIAKLEGQCEKWQSIAMRALANYERLLQTNEKALSIAQSLPPLNPEQKP